MKIRRSCDIFTAYIEIFFWPWSGPGRELQIRDERHESTRAKCSCLSRAEIARHGPDRWWNTQPDQGQIWPDQSQLQPDYVPSSQIWPQSGREFHPCFWILNLGPARAIVKFLHEVIQSNCNRKLVGPGLALIELCVSTSVWAMSDNFCRGISEDPVIQWNFHCLYRNFTVGLARPESGIPNQGWKTWPEHSRLQLDQIPVSQIWS